MEQEGQGRNLVQARVQAGAQAGTTHGGNCGKLLRVPDNFSLLPPPSFGREQAVCTFFVVESGFLTDLLSVTGFQTS